MAATIREVAARAGVSPMAVSKVLHGKGENVRVGAETAERIRRAARELRYQPNTLARSLRTHRTQTIGVVLEHFERLGLQNGYDLQLLNGVMGVVYPAEYTLAICPKLVKGSVDRSVGDGRFDGVLWCKPSVTEKTIEEMRSSSVPVVLMHVPPNVVEGLPSYCCDNFGAMKLGVDHLYELGHRRIAFVVDPGNAETAEGKTRADGFCAALKARGLVPEVVVWGDEPSVLEPYRSPHAPHTGIVVFSEAHAVQILGQCQAMGIRVPQDLSIVGFDSTPYCDVTTPRLTAIFQPIEQMARDATRQLLALIDGQPPTQPLGAVYPCGFDVRESTAPPRA